MTKELEFLRRLIIWAIDDSIKNDEQFKTEHFTRYEEGRRSAFGTVLNIWMKQAENLPGDWLEVFPVSVNQRSCLTKETNPMNNTDKATERPWQNYVIDKRVLICRDLTGKQIASMDESDMKLDNDIANAELIVKAVNNHDQLLEVLKDIDEWCDSTDGSFESLDEIRQRVKTIARKAIKQAEGE